MAESATPTTRERLLATTARLFRRHGYSGTGLNQVVAEAPAPFGSLYHHFPGGKTQLGVEAIALSGRGYVHLIDRVIGQAPDPFVGTERFFRLIADVLRDSGFADGCPIATVSVEIAGTEPALHNACGQVFASWRAALANHLEGWVPEDERLALATSSLAAFEGAIILAQAERDLTILDITAATTVATLRAAERRTRTTRRT